MATFSSSVFTILALAAYIFVMRRAASRENAPGLWALFRLLLAAFFVCVALSTAAGVSVLLAAQVLVLGYFTEEGVLPPAVSPWTMTSSYLIGSITTALVFHRAMSWYFGYLSGLPGERPPQAGRPLTVVSSGG